MSLPSGFGFRGLKHRLQGEDLAEPRIAWTADAGDRVERLGLDLAVLQQPIADVERQHFADNQPAAGLAEFKALPEAALHRDGCCGETRHLDAFARQRLELQLL